MRTKEYSEGPMGGKEAKEMKLQEKSTLSPFYQRKNIRGNSLSEVF